MTRENLMAGPPPTLLTEDAAAAEAAAALRAGEDPAKVAARCPAHSAAWAALAARVIATDPVTAYAYARTGYHRGLDQLRHAGWRGQGPVPWEHEPNQGFLSSLYFLGVAAAAIGEEDEAKRCREFLADSSPAAVSALSQRARH